MNFVSFINGESCMANFERNALSCGMELSYRFFAQKSRTSMDGSQAMLRTNGVLSLNLEHPVPGADVERVRKAQGEDRNRHGVD